jgi:glycosyltransferase involved in cell wall biosynthesis
MHNAEDTIERCLESIAAQTMPARKVLVVDDASTDGSVALVDRLSMPSVEVLRLPGNVGPGAARNRGVARAETEWVAFLDSDNEWRPTFLEELTAAVVSTDAGFGAGGGVRHKVRAGRSQNRLLTGKPEAADRTSDYWRMSLDFMPVVPSSAFVRRSAFDAVGGFPEDVRTGEDITLFARLWLRETFVFVNKPLYISTQRPGSITAGGRTYHDVRLLLGRVGMVFLTALARRRQGSGWFAVAYTRMVVGRHVDWLWRTLRRPRADAGMAQAQGR